MGLDSLQGRRDKAKLKWWYKVATMPEHRYSRKLFVQEWNVKPRRGRQRKYWCKVVDHLFSSLGLDKAEWLEDIRKGSCSLKSFLGVAGEGIDERESSKFEEGLNRIALKCKTLGVILRCGLWVHCASYCPVHSAPP